MRIVTVNLPEAFLKTIDTLCGDGGLYPSRSELVRVAIREFLVRELTAAKAFLPMTPLPMKPGQPNPAPPVPLAPIAGEVIILEDGTRFRIVHREERR